MKSRLLKEILLMTGIFIVVLTISFYDVVFLGKTFKIGTASSQALSYGVYGQKDNRPKFIPVNGTDSPVLEEPIYQFIKENLNKGILPLWNPHQACGFPLIAMLEVGIFFPLNLILYLLPQLYSWDLLIFARFLLGGMLTYVFMRTLRFRKIPSFVSGIVFMLTGPMVLLQYWTANVDIMAPFVLLTLERIIQKQTYQNLSLVAIAFGLTIFAGHPEHIFFVHTVAILFFFFRLLTLKKSFDKKTLTYTAFAYILGLGLSAVTLFPFIQNLLSEFWITHPIGVGLTTGEMKERAITLALPYFFQKETLTYDFTFSGWWGGYIGILPFVLSFLGLFSKQRKGLNYFFSVMAILIIGKMYCLPFINWIGYLPIFNVCRFYIHTAHLFALMMAILAGMGARFILLQKNLFKKGLIFSVLLFMIILWHLFYLREANHFSISLQASLLAVGILSVFQLFLFLSDRKILKRKYLAFILVFLVAGELFLYIHRERPKRFDSFPPVPYIETLKKHPKNARMYGVFWSFYPNTASAYQMDDLGIYFSLLSKRFVHFTNQLLVPDFFKIGLRPPALRVLPIRGAKNFLNLLNINYIITPAQLLPNTKIFLDTIAKDDENNQLVYSREVTIYRRPNVFPRAFVVHRAIFETDEKNIFESIKEIKDELKEVAVIEGDPTAEMKERLQNLPAADTSTAQITKYTPNEVAMDVYMEYPGFLILSDAYHPDWRVFVNDKPSTIYPADYFLRSVFLTSGSYKIKFVFQPVFLYIGAIVSAIAFLLTIGLWIRGKFLK